MNHPSTVLTHERPTQEKKMADEKKEATDADIDLKASVNALMEKIAQKHLHIDTLETRNSDQLDFHDCAVWSIKAALLEAFKAGHAVGAAVGVPK